MKYLIPTQKLSEPIKQIFTEYPMRSGFYNWVKVMDADIREYDDFKDDLEKYDVVHCNMPPVDWSMILEISRRLKNSSTKLVLNNDHVSEYWQKWGLDPIMYREIQECGDVVFGTEPFQTSQMIDRAITIPHPTNTKEMKLLKNKAQDKNWVGFMCHTYDRSLTQKVLLSKDLKQMLNCKTALYNYVEGDMASKTTGLHWFDEKNKQFEFPKFCMNIMKNRMMLELSDYHTYGRCSVETAALSIPTIGTDRVFSMKINFPNLICDPYDHRTIRQLCKKVWEDDKFRQEQIDIAYENVEYFNYSNSKARLMEALDNVRK